MRWQGDIRGIYTARHGYRLLTSASIHTDPQLHFVEWQKLWKLPVPLKVKNFLWRCMRNILQVREMLKARHVWERGGCLFCLSNMETMDHLFCSCPIKAQVWHDFTILHNDSLVLLLNGALCSPSVKGAIHVAAKLWLLWNARNDVVWKGKLLRITDLLSQAAWLSDLWFSTYTRGVADTDVAPTAASWTPSPPHRLKCNVDAAVFEDSAGFGLVVKDHARVFVSAYNARLGCGRDLYLVEAMVVREALSWLMSNGYTDFILEPDSLNFCSSFNSCLLDLSYVGLLVEQCHCIANDIGNVFVHHVRRSVNRVAHVLAWAIGSSSVLGSWVSVPPTCIAHLVSY
ncbi:uncharacterized protein LOC116003943 [Ipomoea triloba]|uniref:uncharacterized protein LOC116003943 n=1 Tax=Ipomoea triloba TaxID=35885 RepID=UPI00125DCB3E|nr:uncharacterized protein LOC116003943 [Ipomoea triloba]